MPTKQEFQEWNYEDYCGELFALQNLNIVKEGGKNGIKSQNVQVSF